MSKACLVCNSMDLEMMRISQHPRKLNLILKLELQAKQDDYLCKTCCGDVVSAFDAKEKVLESSLNLLETNGAVVPDEINADLSEVEVRIEPRSDDEREEDLVDPPELQELELDENIQVGTGVEYSNNETGTITDTKESGTERSYTCEYCAKIFKKRRKYTLHIGGHEHKMRHSCSDCGKSFTKPASLTAHKLLHSEKHPFSCSSCCKTFASERSLKSHARTHTHEKPYTCKECGKNFTTLSYLNVHKKYHTGIKSFSCNHCPKKFVTKGCLKVHVRSHANVRPYECSQCGKAFSYPSNLYIHKKVHRSKPLFNCDKCSKIFRTKIGLQKHITRLHEDDIIESTSETE